MNDVGAIILAAALGAIVGLGLGFRAGDVKRPPPATTPRELPRWACREVVDARLLRLYLAEHGRPPAVLHYREPDPCR